MESVAFWHFLWASVIFLLIIEVFALGFLAGVLEAGSVFIIIGAHMASPTAWLVGLFTLGAILYLIVKEYLNTLESLGERMLTEMRSLLMKPLWCFVQWVGLRGCCNSNRF
jgi:hypothetical protein